jgi:DNA topoisomerase-3
MASRLLFDRGYRLFKANRTGLLGNYGGSTIISRCFAKQAAQKTTQSEPDAKEKLQKNYKKPAARRTPAKKVAENNGDNVDNVKNQTTTRRKTKITETNTASGESQTAPTTKRTPRAAKKADDLKPSAADPSSELVAEKPKSRARKPKTQTSEGATAATSEASKPTKRSDAKKESADAAPAATAEAKDFVKPSAAVKKSRADLAKADAEFQKGLPAIQKVEEKIKEFKKNAGAKLTVILAEKPSVGIDIGRALKIQNEGQLTKGYFGNVKYDAKSPNITVVTWCFGHMLDVTDKEGAAKVWRVDVLPIVPDALVTVPPAEEVKKRLALEQICMFFRHADEIVAATDAGREGELIFREIYAFSGSAAPVKRLWISSQTDRAIIQGFKALRDIKEFDPLYAAADSRRYADWLVGINLTKLYTLLYREKFFGNVVSVGRVQTPVLRMITDRALQHNSFIPQPYYEMFINCQHKGSTFKLQWANKTTDTAQRKKFLEKKDAIAARDSCIPTMKVVDVKQEKVEEKGPLLFDLTSLQKEMNTKHALSASKTLAIAQSLYERHKLITYPRTSSRFLPNSSRPMAAALIKQFTQAPKNKYFDVSSIRAVNKDLVMRKSAFVFNETKVTDHHALLPTLNSDWQELASKLDEKELVVFIAITKRFLSLYLPDVEKTRYELKAENNGNIFVASYIVVNSPGWRAIYQGELKKDPEEDRKFPPLQVGQELQCTVPPTVEEKSTKPPAYFTEASLLTAMQSPTKYIETNNITENEDIAEEWGLGTASTRAGIIERLTSVGYIKKNNRALFPTRKGIRFIKLIQDEPIANVATTGKWEHALSKIKNGKLPANEFTSGIKTMVSEHCTRYKDPVNRPLLPAGIDLYHTYLQDPMKLGPIADLKDCSCPKCNTPNTMKQNIEGYFCVQPTCNFALPRVLDGIEITELMAKTIVREKKVVVKAKNKTIELTSDRCYPVVK